MTTTNNHPLPTQAQAYFDAYQYLSDGYVPFTPDDPEAYQVRESLESLGCVRMRVSSFLNPAPTLRA